MDDETPKSDTIPNQSDAPKLTVIDGGAGDDPPKAKRRGNAKRRKLTAKQERLLPRGLRLREHERSRDP